MASAAGRWVLLATVLGSAVAAIDATVVGIALPSIGAEFHTGLAAPQWVVTAYTFTLAGLLLVAGALGTALGGGAFHPGHHLVRRGVAAVRHRT